MALPCFTSWTVLPHEPIQKLEDNLWIVHGSMPDPSIKRTMTIAKRSDGSLLVHNAVALNDDGMKQIDAWGPVAFIVVPNGHHRQDCLIWKQRYPQAKVVCPRGIKKAVEKCVAVDAHFDDVAKDAAVELIEVDGMGGSEGFLVVNSGDKRTVVTADILCNQHGVKGISKFLSAPTECVSVPRIARILMVKDKKALKAHLERLAGPSVQRLIVCHGDNVMSDAHVELKAAAARL